LLSSQFHAEDSSLGSTGGAIAAAATAGVGMITDGIKSLWGSYVTSSPNAAPMPAIDRSSPASSKPAKKASSTSFVLPESYYNPNSPAGKARQLERYLNYLLEHIALSTSFPLNTILKVGL
jgi:hypothetical protein